MHFPIRTCINCLLVVSVLSVFAVPAQAQWMATPYLGVNLAGDAEFRRGGPGAAIGYVGDRFGFEFDAQRYHHFFKDRNVELVDNNCGVSGVTGPCIDLNTDAWSVMGNALAMAGRGGKKWRAYGVAGAGVIRPWVEGGSATDGIRASQTDFALNAGIGVLGALSNRVGVRADLRYFHAFVDEDHPGDAYARDYGFVRAAIGITLRVR